jgi:hypothetical protein
MCMLKEIELVYVISCVSSLCHFDDSLLSQYNDGRIVDICHSFLVDLRSGCKRLQVTIRARLLKTLNNVYVIATRS